MSLAISIYILIVRNGRNYNLAMDVMNTLIKC